MSEVGAAASGVGGRSFGEAALAEARGQPREPAAIGAELFELIAGPLPDLDQGVLGHPRVAGQHEGETVKFW